MLYKDVDGLGILEQVVPDITQACGEYAMLVIDFDDGLLSGLDKNACVYAFGIRFVEMYVLGTATL